MAMNPSVNKRQKEKARQDKQQDKEQKRLKRLEANAVERAANVGEIPGVAEFLREAAAAAAAEEAAQNAPPRPNSR